MTIGTFMKTVLITGTNRGIGLGLTKLYLSSGWRVIACCRDISSMAAVSKGMARDGQLISVELSMTDPKSIKSAVELLMDLEVNLDLVIANAGVAISQSIEKWEFEALVEAFSVNAAGVAIFAKELRCLLSDGTKFCAMSSGMGSMELQIGVGGDGEGYAMSKAALNMLCVHLAARWKGSGIGVYAISPGWVRTDMGGPAAEITVEKSSQKLAALIDRLTLAESGRFLTNEGEEIPW